MRPCLTLHSWHYITIKSVSQILVWILTYSPFIVLAQVLFVHRAINSRHHYISGSLTSRRRFQCWISLLEERSHWNHKTNQCAHTYLIFEIHQVKVSTMKYSNQTTSHSHKGLGLYKSDTGSSTNRGFRHQVFYAKNNLIPWAHQSVCTTQIWSLRFPDW